MQPDIDSPNRFGLRSKNILLENSSQPTEAIILIEDGKISQIHLLSELDQDSIETINANWRIEDYGDLYIFPGIIDTNVHLHAGHSNEWDNIYYTTGLAASAGITTIVDNPILTKPFTTGEDYLQILQQRIELLKQNSSVDFAFYGLLEERTMNSVQQILDLGAIGLKCYLLNCFQHDVGFIKPENLQSTLETLSHAYPNLLLAFHPEIATERELYLSSPCRFDEPSKRLDLDHEIKSIGLGGAANKGSFLEDPEVDQAKEVDSDNLDEIDDDVDTPSKLEPHVKKQKEKSEITQLAHFELLSYTSETKNQNQSSSSDSDLEILPEQDETSENCQMKRKMEKLSFSEEKIIEVDSEDTPMTPVPNHDSEEKVDSALQKKSLFSKKTWNLDEENPQSIEIEDTDAIRKSTKSDYHPSLKGISKKSFLEDNGSCSLSMEGTQDLEGIESFSLISTENEPAKSMPQISLSLSLFRNNTALAKINSNKFFLEDEEEENHSKINKFLSSPPSLFLKNRIKSTSDLVTLPVNHQESPSQSENSEVPRFRKKLQISTQFDDNSPSNQKAPPQVSSPFRKPLTPNSSLLKRRLSRRVEDTVDLSEKSSISSPASVLSRISFIDVSKSPVNVKKVEAALNRNYKVFLANRPQNWEENGVCKIISACQQNQNIPLRILIQNISLASSLLKLRKLKKKNKNPKLTISGETATPYLLFSEKMVKKGETKYKAAPPLREKENRKLLVENLRLGGVDIISSYHFYVPPRYKAVEDGNFRRAFNGFNSIGCNLQGLWTILQSYYIKKSEKYTQDPSYKKKINAEILLKTYETLCLNPAKLLKIDHCKGSIAQGKDADFVIWDPFKINSHINSSPDHLFYDKKMKGIIHKTFLRGHLIFSLESENKIQHYSPKLIKPLF